MDTDEPYEPRTTDTPLFTSSVVCRLVIYLNEFDLVGLTVDLYRRLYAVCVFDAEGFLFAARAVGAGGRLEYAYFENFIAALAVAAGNKARRKHYCDKHKCKNFFHCFIPPIERSAFHAHIAADMQHFDI